jgi:hypothetical protein
MHVKRQIRDGLSLFFWKDSSKNIQRPRGDLKGAWAEGFPLQFPFLTCDHRLGGSSLRSERQHTAVISRPAAEGSQALFTWRFLTLRAWNDGARTVLGLLLRNHHKHCYFPHEILFFDKPLKYVILLSSSV